MNISENKSIDVATVLKTGVVGMGVFFSRGDSYLSDLICRLTDSPWSHMGIFFRLADGSVVYYEALVGRTVNGPIPLQCLIDWAQKSEKRNFILIDLPALAPLALSKLVRVQTYVGRVGYAELQLLGMLAFEKWGWPILSTPRRVVCSELGARILYPEMDLTEPAHPTLDSVNPGSAYRRLKMLLDRVMFDNEVEALGI